eukprot:TRINITY_DN1250_c1_g1_i3.p2 TRINITY_DN1250_c1_g1~~TRINITY_DN1250_c1_g1_i3.p2  ORF type:complete len:237 (+),score=1.86 TRINITY_DN1250_c1_g1_i3:3-713(+)
MTNRYNFFFFIFCRHCLFYCGRLNNLGFMGTSFAAYYPATTIGLVLINSAGRLNDNYNIYKDMEKIDNMMSGADLGPPRLVANGLGGALFVFLELSIRRVLKNLYPVNSDRADQFLVENIYKSACDLGAKDVFQSVFYLAPPRPLNFLISHLYQGPTLVLQGILDPLNDAKSRALQLEKLCSNINIELLQAGHCPHDEVPELVNHRILEFADQLCLKLPLSLDLEEVPSYAKASDI